MLTCRQICFRITQTHHRVNKQTIDKSICSSSSFPTPVTPGVAQSFTVSGLDAANNVVTDGTFVDAVTISTSDTAAVGFPTLRLVRMKIGPFDLGSLKPGQWRDLTRAEQQLLPKHR